MGAFMEILASFGFSVDSLKLFAVGMATGTLLLAMLMAALRKPAQAQSLARRVGKLEMRLAASRDFAAIALALKSVDAHLPTLTSAATTTLFSALAPARRPANRTDPEQVAREFSQAMRDNTMAAVQIAQAIIDQGVNLDDAKDRRDIAGRIRKAGQALSTKFWDSHGEFMLQSALPANLKELLRVFFARVKRLKEAVSGLAKDPSFADLDALLEHAIDLIDTAKSIVDELEKHAGT